MNNNKRILLLEDNEELRDGIKDVLEAHFQNVVTVDDGVEGLRKIGAGNFDVILCGSAKTLPSDMFYLAVTRLRPYLTRQFVFITAPDAGAKILKFIRQVGGVMLDMPFNNSDLLEALAFVQLRASLTSGAAA
jgi:CheY-like chemotaxis protein